MSFLGRRLGITISARAPSSSVSSRCYSHGATVGEVYASYRKFDEHLGRTRPDLIGDPVKIDELQAKGELTPLMAAHFKKEIAHSVEAKSLSKPSCQ